jgi:hypothetical protein
VEHKSRPRTFRDLVSYFITSVVAGALAGSGLIFFYSFFIVAPIWGPRMYKGDERWETIFFIASTLLPISVIAGIVLALIGFHFLSFRLKHRGVLISCLALWFLISANRPVVSRIRRPGFPDPKFETVPDTMVSIVCLLFVVTIVSCLIQWWVSRNDIRVAHDGITKLRTGARDPAFFTW